MCHYFCFPSSIEKHNPGWKNQCSSGVARIALSFPGLDPRGKCFLGCIHTRRRAAQIYCASHWRVCVLCEKLLQAPEVLSKRHFFLHTKTLIAPSCVPKVNRAPVCMRLFGVCVLRLAFYYDKKIWLVRILNLEKMIKAMAWKNAHATCGAYNVKIIFSGYVLDLALRKRERRIKTIWLFIYLNFKKLLACNCSWREICRLFTWRF